MCGIAGVFHLYGLGEQDLAVVKRMNEIQRHRGPDDEGIYSGNHCILGHRRLSIIDLSSDGHQPFSSHDGRYQIIYNGEIYNYIELREELVSSGCIFRTKTDTEVLLKSYEQYGAACLSRLNGMFAFAIYDSMDNTLFLARDRVGIKPLYYHLAGNKLYFTSEIKALASIPDLRLTVNDQSVFDFLTFNRTDVFDETFSNEIKRIPKGHYALFDSNGFKIKQWWNPESYLRSGDPDISLEEASGKVEDILISAVKLRMRSDVPVGSCLSGGLDSSIITGILYSHHEVGKNYSTFTASFPGDPIDESSYVEQLNKRYPFVNFRTSPNADSAFHNLKEFVHYNDEPTTSPSFYSQYEVMRLAKEKGVTVLLDGQGGDENFAGYQYFHGFYLYGLFKKFRLFDFFKELFTVALRKQDKSAFQTLLFQVLPGKIRKSLLLNERPWIDPDYFHHHIEKSLIYNHFFDAPDLNTSLVRHFQYKLEHLLRMEDRNSMAFSLEARVPYLDYRLIEYVLSLPDSYKIHEGETKYLQKRAAGKYTVPEILNRKDKIGFGTPTGKWMKNENWQVLTKESFSEMKKTFPGILRKDAPLPDDPTDQWKINQLMQWHNLFIK